MRNRPPMNNASVIGAAVLTTTILVAVMMTTAVPRSAKATTDMAKATGQPCTKCHTAVPALNSYGKKYKNSIKH